MSAMDHKAQSAFAAFFQLMQAQGVAAFADMVYAPDAEKLSVIQSTIQPALTGNAFQLPGIVCRASEFQELTPGCNVWCGKMAIIFNSQLDDDRASNPSDPEATSLHSVRTRAGYQLLFDVSKDESDPVARALALPYLNKPASGPDTRAVKGFTCSCYTLSEPETNGWDNHHVETSFALDVFCSFGDPS